MSDPRQPNAPANLGFIGAKTTGRVDDEPMFDSLPVNRAHDMDLMFALAARGYDVTLRAPTEATIAKRRKQGSDGAR